MKALKILFMLFIFSTLVSQSAMDFFSVLLCGQWVWIFWKQRKSQDRFSLLNSFGLEKVWGVWILIVLIGFLLNIREPQYMLTRIIEFKWILILYVLIEVFAFIKPDKKALDFIFWMMGFIAVINVVLYLADISLLDSWRYGTGPEGFVRAGGLFVEPMTFSHSFSLYFCFLIGLIGTNFHSWNFRQRTVGLGIASISALGLYWSFTRGVWIGLVLSIAGTLLWLRPRYSVVFLILIGGLFASLYNYSPDFHWRVDRSLTEVSGFSERKLLWRAHAEIFKDHPLFGVGYGQNTQMLPEYYEKMGIPSKTLRSHAHNQFLHLAAGTGVFGLMCYIVVWIFFFLYLIALWKQPLDSWDRGVVLGFFLAQTSFLISGMTEANFEHSKVRFVVMLMWAYIVYLGRKYQVVQQLLPTRRRI